MYQTSTFIQNSSINGAPIRQERSSQRLTLNDDSNKPSAINQNFVSGQGGFSYLGVSDSFRGGFGNNQFITSGDGRRLERNSAINFSSNSQRGNLEHESRPERKSAVNFDTSSSRYVNSTPTFLGSPNLNKNQNLSVSNQYQHHPSTFFDKDDHKSQSTYSSNIHNELNPNFGSYGILDQTHLTPTKPNTFVQDETLYRDPATGRIERKSGRNTQLNDSTRNPETERLERTSQNFSPSDMNRVKSFEEIPICQNGNSSLVNSFKEIRSERSSYSNQEDLTNIPSISFGIGNAKRLQPNKYGRPRQGILRKAKSGSGRRKGVQFNEGNIPFVEFEPYIQKKQNAQISRPPQGGGSFTPLGPSQLIGSNLNLTPGVGHRTFERRSERGTEHRLVTNSNYVSRSYQEL